jgi:hypothetical protein
VCVTIADYLKFFANTFIIFYLYENIKHVAGPTMYVDLIMNIIIIVILLELTPQMQICLIFPQYNTDKKYLASTYV